MAHEAERPTPTTAELDVLQVLWKQGPSTVREVHEHVSRERTVGYTTILKQMQVMHEKGLLVRTERFRAHVYEPSVPSGRTRRQLAQSLLVRAFDGSARELLQSALAGRRVSGAEIAEIRSLLDELDRKRS
ncbi:MAG: BlaI/MecI/CopY family transcriptional regulator [Vicinamibacteria bacterium]